MAGEHPDFPPLQVAPGAAPPQGTVTNASAADNSEDEAAEFAAPAGDPASVIPIPPTWQPLKDWLTAPRPAFAGDLHTVQFWLGDINGITHHGQMYYKPPPNTGHFSYHHFLGTGYVIPNFPWVNRYEQVNGAYDQLPAPWVRIAIDVRLNASGAQVGTSGLTYFQSSSGGEVPGTQVGYVEVDSPELAGGPAHFVTGLNRSILYLFPTTALL